jgi:carotenoid cleavage dioxygenase
MDGSKRIDPYLSGNFAPVRAEDDFEMTVVGEIPEGLAGAFYRNGPNPQFDPIDDYHWFSGDGMIHGFFPQMVAGKRRRPRPLGHLRQSDDQRSFGDRQGRRDGQHQYRLARRPADGAGGGPCALRA